MAKARMLAPERAPGDPAPEPGLVKKPSRKKNRKKRFWKNKAREASRKPGDDPRGVAVRPPKAPEDFSQNWKVLRELLKPKSQALEESLVPSRLNSRKQPQRAQPSRKAVPDRAERSEVGTENTAPEASGGAAPSPRLPTQRKRPASRTQAGRRAQHREKEAKTRTSGDISPKRGDAKHKKRKAKEVTAPLPPAPPTEADIWFDGVDPADIEAALGPEAAQVARKQLGQSESGVTLVKERAFDGLTRALALDCEMVGVGPQGDESMLARVSLVNQFGKCVYDKYVKPTQPVTDYRTAVSGIRPENLAQGEEFEIVQKEVAALLKGRILVGHALHNDLKVLFLGHPKKKVRDTQKYRPFRSQVKSGRPSLKLLAEKILGLPVQQAEHCSVQDAQAAMRLYISVKREWESLARDRHPSAPALDACSHRT